MVNAKRSIGFSTGSLCGSDFRSAIESLNNTGANAVELSALREAELYPLLVALPDIPLGKYDYVSIHAPSVTTKYTERDLVRMLRKFVPPDYPVIVHADIIRNMKVWKNMGTQLCIENMDKRKQTGRTVGEMRSLLSSLPKASLCLDLAHARQVDPSLNETVSFLLEFRSRLRQIHVSELNSASKHESLSFAGVAAVQSIRDLIPGHAPVILEFAAEPQELESYLRFVTRLLERTQLMVRLEAG